MGYGVWLKVEDEDGQPGDPDEVFISLTRFDTRKEAIAHAEEVASLEYARTGIEPGYLDYEEDE